MAQRDQRPPRAARPASTLSPTPPHPTRQSLHSRPQSQLLPPPEPQRGVSFQGPNQSGRPSKPIDPHRQRSLPSPYLNSPPPDAETGHSFDNAKVLRKKTLVRPDREKIEPGHRQWHYRSHVAQLENDGSGRVGVRPSTTGNYPQRETLQRGRSILGREEDVHESGLALFRRGTGIRRKRHQPAPQRSPSDVAESKKRSGCLDNIGPGPKGPWMAYCFIFTCFVPPILLRSCGIVSPEQQRAWREKMGMIGIILLLMAGVGFLTFGFTEAVCGTPPKRFHGGQISNNSVIIHGYDYDFSRFKHPRTTTVFNGQSNPLLEGGWNLAGNDASFLFQKVNQHCLGLISKASNSTITGTGNTLDWYFPCNIYDQHGTSGVNLTGYTSSTNCHVNVKPGSTLNNLKQGQVYYTWDDVHKRNRNLAVFESSVLDLNLLQWLSRAQVNYPAIFDKMIKADGTYNRKDITMLLYRVNQRSIGHCLQDIVTVGFIDTNSIGCVASQVVLYLSLVFIVGVVAIRFVMAVMFQWFFSWKLGNFPRETYEQRMKRAAEIENWTHDIYRPAPSQYRPNVSKSGLRPGKEKRKTFLPSHSRFTPSENVPKGNSRSSSAYGMLPSDAKRNTLNKSRVVSDLYRQSRSTMSFGDASRTLVDNPCPFPLQNVVPQPPPDWEPFNFPLAHTICLVTAYSESEKGLRTTLDSLCTTDYPNSHKVVLIISDGMVKGEHNTLTTPEICLGMMKDFVISPNEVEPHSYVAIADGHKRHNMAKVYAGFYNYDDSTVERSKQQRVPIVLVAKVGNPLEISDPKPGNRGKRDSQIILMAFLQKVMFDERMTTFEYEFFNSLWRVTGVSPDRYELVLCVDADTKVFPDSMTRMVSCMVHDEDIMGLCGETKIANKAESFVTMMQVFEYYISHHMTKAFESMFGGVTCLPGCFSMYRIKAPKGGGDYWVPILANPDIVEHYSENVVDTLHKKNLLLLGEDRYLTTLMLKTFPKRKNMFCPQAVCKTVVPDTFHVLISQRRRWINSTIHNLAELLLVRDLCGTFCFSMQFIVGMELAGTLVLPAAICFTLYLIIRSAIPGHTNTIIPLILLGIVLGLPGLLIVVTSRKLEYVGWMLVYLLSLPIWNGILPLYAFWHFDDFSWGQTRRVAGEKTGNEGDKEGEFDSSHIVMKRWAEFERDRRWKNGSHSRDSTFYEKRGDNNRYSLVSDYTPNAPTWESSTLESAGPMPRPRYDSNAVLMLPAPLAAAPQPGLRAVTSMAPQRSSHEEAYMTEVGSGSRTRLIPTPQTGDQYSDSHDSATTLSATPTSPRASVPNFANVNVRSPTSPGQDGQYRHSISGPIVPEEKLSFPSLAETEDSFSNAGPQAVRGSTSTRGVQLMDSGPIPGPEGVRRVSRPSSRRPTSQLPPQNRYSRPDSMYALPPGAAAPQPGYPQPPM